MKKMILGVLLAMVCLQPALAQKRHPNKNKVTPEKMVKRMDKALLLNDDQEKKILEIYTNMFEERKNMTDAQRQNRLAKQEEFKKKVAEVLTEEQNEKWTRVKKAKAKKHKAEMKKNKKNKKNKRNKNN